MEKEKVEMDKMKMMMRFGVVAKEKGKEREKGHEMTVSKKKNPLQICVPKVVVPNNIV